MGEFCLGSAGRIIVHILTPARGGRGARQTKLERGSVFSVCRVSAVENSVPFSRLRKGKEGWLSFFSVGFQQSNIHFHFRPCESDESGGFLSLSGINR